MSRSLMATILISLFGSLLTAAQILLVLFTGEAVCVGDGCRIVENLTTIPPVLFNIAGLLFFQAVFWGTLAERNAPGRTVKAVQVILLAGMACEGVLFSFQYHISQVFCFYCLVIFALVLLLNFSFGSRQAGTSLMLFLSVFAVFSSLQFRSATAGQNEDGSLTRGTYGLRPAPGNGPQLSLFFSASCRYCEEVIELLKQRTGCSIRFQPVEEINGIDFPGMEMAPGYSPEINRDFLRVLGIDQIPVLMVKDMDGIRILRGEGPISSYLARHCQEEYRQSPTSGAGMSTPVQDSVAVPDPDDGACSVFENCEEGVSRQPAGAR